MQANPNPTWSIRNRDTGQALIEATISADAWIGPITATCDYAGYWECTGYNSLSNGVNATGGQTLTVYCNYIAILLFLYSIYVQPSLDMVHVFSCVGSVPKRLTRTKLFVRGVMIIDSIYIYTCHDGASNPAPLELIFSALSLEHGCHNILLGYFNEKVVSNDDWGILS